MRNWIRAGDIASRRHSSEQQEQGAQLAVVITTVAPLDAQLPSHHSTSPSPGSGQIAEASTPSASAIRCRTGRLGR
jgi:hypothetical protein